jgi:hypothetical protein
MPFHPDAVRASLRTFSFSFMTFTSPGQRPISLSAIEIAFCRSSPSVLPALVKNCQFPQPVAESGFPFHDRIQMLGNRQQVCDLASFRETDHIPYCFTRGIRQLTVLASTIDVTPPNLPCGTPRSPSRVHRPTAQLGLCLPFLPDTERCQQKTGTHRT